MPRVQTLLSPILLWSLIARAAAAQPPMPPAPAGQLSQQPAAQQQLDRIGDKVDEAKTKLTDLEQKVQGATDRITKLEIAGSFAGFIIGLLGLSAVLWVQQRTERLVEKRTDEVLEARLSAITQEKLQELDRHFSDLMILITYASRGEHDAAIEATSWDGGEKTLRTYPRALQRLLVLSVAQGEKARKKYGGIAQQAAERLFKDEQNEDTLTLLYALAFSNGDWATGYKYFQRHHESIPIKRNPEGLRALLEILRRQGQFAQAIEAESGYVGPRTLEIAHLAGLIYNNLGHFEEAHRRFEPWIRSFTRQRSGLPALWHWITYNFLLNCIERGQPDLGLEAARFAAEIGYDSLLQLGVLRLALALREQGSAAATELIEQVRRNLGRLERDAMTLQAEALLRARDGDPSTAVAFLREHERDVMAGAFKAQDREREKYFYRCLIAELLIAAKRYEEAHKELHPLALEDRAGEATFLMARAYAAEHRDTEAADFLDRAGRIHRRWCKIARLHPLLVEAHRRIGRELCARAPELPLLPDTAGSPS